MNEPLALLLDDNLMSASRVAAQLERAGFRVQIARAVPATVDAQLILLNLGSRGLNPVELIGVCRAQLPDARLVGFCGHLEIEIRRAAKAAGIKRILTNDEALSDLANSL